MDVIYQDNRIFVCIKPAGILSTDEPGGMPQHIRQWLGDAQACVRTVHRLDQVTSGVMVFARSRAAASILSQQIREERFEKEYLAVINGTPQEKSGEFFDLLWRDKQSKMTRVVQSPGKDVQPAMLFYEVLGTCQNLSLVKILLKTGRTHQIRVQYIHGV